MKYQECDINVGECFPGDNCPEHGGERVLLPEYYIWVPPERGNNKNRVLCRNHADWIVKTWRNTWTAAKILAVVNP